MHRMKCSLQSNKLYPFWWIYTTTTMKKKCFKPEWLPCSRLSNRTDQNSKYEVQATKCLLCIYNARATSCIYISLFRQHFYIFILEVHIHIMFVICTVWHDMRYSGLTSQLYEFNRIFVVVTFLSTMLSMHIHTYSDSAHINRSSSSTKNSSWENTMRLVCFSIYLEAAEAAAAA